MLKGKTIAVCVTGGIAAYKACEIVSRLKKKGADVHVVMTQNATCFVAPLTFETLSGNKVTIKNFDPNREWEVEHVSLAKKCDLFLIAPCTANVVGKLCAGVADDFLTTCIMAATVPVLIAPAMNVNMYQSAAYKANEQILRNRGFIFIEPDSGVLACGDVGKGRLAEPEAIVNKVIEVLIPKRDLDGKTVLVTLGSTREPIDPVRFITNSSSGKMGLSIINAALKRGAKVIAVSGFISVEIPTEAETIKVATTDEMYSAVKEQYNRADFIIMSAAPSDYRVKNYNQSKIKSKELILELSKNTDIAAEIGKVKGDKTLVIFAAETNDLIDNAKSKLKSKNADLVVANDVTQEGAGFYTDTNIATLINKNGKVTPLTKMDKSALADVILDNMQDVR
ncbi:MAG: bifunctional phosphopantothenoylcysteine decarboxylase/phosphopantothenate--cysteine ligase CoaBC [Clostridiales bacterium]|nr:bifunctional phosphopantothenoylcysteine decarboxylase/phosphopantothenate--cysteine ligase CoaBC [Clostridiales bacterium]